MAEFWVPLMSADKQTNGGDSLSRVAIKVVDLVLLVFLFDHIHIALYCHMFGEVSWL